MSFTSSTNPGLTFAPSYTASSSEGDSPEVADFFQELNYRTTNPMLIKLEKERKEQDIANWVQEQVETILDRERSWADAEALWWNDQQPEAHQPRGVFRPMDFSQNSSGKEDPRAARPEARSAVVADFPAPFLSKERDDWWK